MQDSGVLDNKQASVQAIMQDSKMQAEDAKAIKQNSNIVEHLRMQANKQKSYYVIQGR